MIAHPTLFMEKWVKQQAFLKWPWAIIEKQSHCSKVWFEEKRKSGLRCFFDASQTEIGEHAINYRLKFMGVISDKWNTIIGLNNDEMRILLKRAFYRCIVDLVSPYNDEIPNKVFLSAAQCHFGCWSPFSSENCTWSPPE